MGSDEQRSEDGKRKRSVVAFSSHCLCRGCDVEFSNLDQFDEHRVGPVDSRKCLSPESLELVEYAGIGEHTYWGSREHADTVARMTTARAGRK